MLPNIKKLTQAVKREIEFEWLEKYFYILGMVAVAIGITVMAYHASKLADERASAYRSTVEANRLEMVLEVKLSDKWNDTFIRR